MATPEYNFRKSESLFDEPWLYNDKRVIWDNSPYAWQDGQSPYPFAVYGEPYYPNDVLSALGRVIYKDPNKNYRDFNPDNYSGVDLGVQRLLHSLDRNESINPYFEDPYKIYWRNKGKQQTPAPFIYVNNKPQYLEKLNPEIYAGVMQDANIPTFVHKSHPQPPGLRPKAASGNFYIYQDNTIPQTPSRPPMYKDTQDIGSFLSGVDGSGKNNKLYAGQQADLYRKYVPQDEVELDLFGIENDIKQRVQLGQQRPERRYTWTNPGYDSFAEEYPLFDAIGRYQTQSDSFNLNDLRERSSSNILQGEQLPEMTQRLNTLYGYNPKGVIVDIPNEIPAGRETNATTVVDNSLTDLPGVYYKTNESPANVFYSNTPQRIGIREGSSSINIFDLISNDEALKTRELLRFPTRPEYDRRPVFVNEYGVAVSAPNNRLTNLGGTETDTAQFARLTNLGGTETDTAQFAQLPLVKNKTQGRAYYDSGVQMNPRYYGDYIGGRLDKEVKLNPYYRELPFGEPYERRIEPMLLKREEKRPPSTYRGEFTYNEYGKVLNPKLLRPERFNDAYIPAKIDGENKFIPFDPRNKTSEQIAADLTDAYIAFDNNKYPLHGEPLTTEYFLSKENDLDSEVYQRRNKGNNFTYTPPDDELIAAPQNKNDIDLEILSISDPRKYEQVIAEQNLLNPEKKLKGVYINPDLLPDVDIFAAVSERERELRRINASLSLMENPLSSSFVDLTNQDAYSPFKQEYTRLKERQAFLSEEISKAKNLVEKLYGLEPQGSFTYTLPEDIKRKEYNRFVSSLEQSPLVFETEPKNLLDPKDKYKSITGSYEYEYPDLSSSSEKVLYPRYDGKVPRRKQEYVETQEGLAPITGDYYTESPEFLRNKRVQTEEARQRIEERKRRGLNQNIKPVTSPSYLIDLSNYPVGQDVGYGVPASRVATPTIKPKTAIELALERPPKKESKDPLLSLFEKLVQKQEERKNYVLAPEIELPPFTLQGVDVNRYLLPPGSDSRRSPSPSISINKNRTLKDSMREIAKTLQPQLQPQPQPSIDPYDFEDPRFGSRQPQPQPSIDPYDFEDPRFGFRQPQLQEPTSRQPRPQTAQPQLQEPTSRQPRPQTAQPEPQPRITNLGGTETDTAQFARLTNLGGTETDTAQFARLTNLGGTETDTAQFAQPSISTRRNLGKVAAAAIPAAFATFFLTKYLNDKKQEEEKRNYRNNQLRNYQDFNIYE